MAELNSHDIAVAGEVVRGVLTSKASRTATGRPGQALAAELLELVVNQSLIPILVSLTAARLDDVLKERRLQRLNREQAVGVISRFLGAEVEAPPEVLEPTAWLELRRLLSPMGLSDQEIKELIEEVHRKLSQ